MNKTLVALLLAIGLAPPASAQQHVQIGHTLSAESHYGKGADAFAETLQELSGGRWTASQAPAGSLGGERDMIEGLQIGAMDMVISSTGPLGNFVPEVYALDLPFLFRDYAHARTVLDGEIGDELLAILRRNDLVGLAWSENGFRHITNSQRPVRSPQDLDGLKFRTLENQVHMEAFEAMGAAPTPMAFPELLPALQQGVVDGQENPVPVIVSSRLWEVQDYLSLTGHVYAPAVVLISPIIWDGLSAEEQGWFHEAAMASAEVTRNEVTHLERSGVALLRKNGMDVIENLDKTPFAELAKQAYTVYTDQYGTEMIERILATQ